MRSTKSIILLVVALGCGLQSELKPLPTRDRSAHERPPRWTPKWTSFAGTSVLAGSRRKVRAPKSLTRGRIGVEPALGFEPRTCALRMHCSATELSWLLLVWHPPPRRRTGPNLRRRHLERRHDIRQKAGRKWNPCHGARAGTCQHGGTLQMSRARRKAGGRSEGPG